jgi:hypothetical protein
MGTEMAGGGDKALGVERKRELVTCLIVVYGGDLLSHFH